MALGPGTPLGNATTAAGGGHASEQRNDEPTPRGAAGSVPSPETPPSSEAPVSEATTAAGGSHAAQEAGCGAIQAEAVELLSLSEATTAAGGSHAAQEAGCGAVEAEAAELQSQDDDSGFCSEPPEAVSVVSTLPPAADAFLDWAGPHWQHLLSTSDAFLEWAGPHWEHLFNAFRANRMHEAFLDGCPLRPGMRRVDFKATVAAMGFTGDAGAVFDAVVSGRSQETGGASSFRRQEYMHFLDLKRYKDRHAPRASDSDVVDQLVSALRKRRRTALRAWRLDLDRHGTGKVGFNDFVAACRAYRISDSKSIWKTLCPNGGPLSFADLAPGEAENVEALVEAANAAVGSDLSRAWDVIDIHRSRSLTLYEFKRGAQRIGFEGDCRLLYDGIAVGPASKVTRADLTYLGKLRKPQPGANLVAWASREWGGADNLVAQLGLTASVEDAMSTEDAMSAEDLEAHLVALGYPFDARRAAAAAASGDAPRVTRSSLMALFKGRARDRTATAMAGRQREAARPGWDNALCLTSFANAGLPANCRTYFSDHVDRSVRQELKTKTRGSPMATCSLYAPYP